MRGVLLSRDCFGANWVCFFSCFTYMLFVASAELTEISIINAWR